MGRKMRKIGATAFSLAMAMTMNLNVFASYDTTEEINEAVENKKGMYVETAKDYGEPKSSEKVEQEEYLEVNKTEKSTNDGIIGTNESVVENNVAPKDTESIGGVIFDNENVVKTNDSTIIENNNIIQKNNNTCEINNSIIERNEIPDGKEIQMAEVSYWGMLQEYGLVDANGKIVDVTTLSQERDVCDMLTSILSNYAFYSFGAWEGEERSVLLNNEKGVILDANGVVLNTNKGVVNVTGVDSVEVLNGSWEEYNNYFKGKDVNNLNIGLNEIYYNDGTIILKDKGYHSLGFDGWRWGRTVFYNDKFFDNYNFEQLKGTASWYLAEDEETKLFDTYEDVYDAFAVKENGISEKALIMICEAITKGGADKSDFIFLDLSEKDKQELTKFLEKADFSKNGIEKGEIKDLITVGGAAFECGLGTLDVNALDRDTTMENETAEENFLKLCKLHIADWNTDDYEIIGFYNVDKNNIAGQKVTNSAGLMYFVLDDIDGTKVLKPSTKLVEGQTYHLYYVFNKKTKQVDPIVVKTGSNENTQEPVTRAETTFALTNYQYTPAGYVPYVAGNIKNAGWNAIVESINANAGKAKTVAITMNGTKTVDKQVLKSAVATNTSLILGLDNNVKVGLSPETMAQIMATQTSDGNIVNPFLELSTATYRQAIGTPVGTCGFTREEMESINAGLDSPVLKVETSNIDRSKKMKISFDASKIGLEAGKMALLYGGASGQMGGGIPAIVDENGMVTYDVVAVNGFWMIGKADE